MVGMLSSGSGALMYALTVGVALGSFQAIQAMVYAHHFGRTHAGEIRGVTFVITIVGAALGSLLFGVSSSHGYTAVLSAGAALCALTAASNLIVRPPVRKDISHGA